MTDKDYMRIAISEAVKSKEPTKCGVVIVKNNKIISKAFNSQRNSKDASAHAEINAIRAAGKALENKNLEGCVIYGTCEPCVMCLSAIIYSNINKAVYGSSLEEISPENRIKVTTNELLSKSPRKIEIIKDVLKEECDKLLLK